MEFFETPCWDGDNSGCKLTDDLFRPFVVSAKVTKKRKRNKYPRGSVSGEQSHPLDYPTEGKVATLGKNKSFDLGKINDKEDESLVSEGKVSQKVIKRAENVKVQPSEAHTESIGSSSNGSSIKSVSLCKSTLNSAILSNTPVKRTKKKKKDKHPKFVGENMKIKSDHILKSLPYKLDLDVEVDTCGKQVNEDTCSDAKELEFIKNITQTETLNDSSHTIKKLRMKASVNLNNDFVEGNLSKEIKHEMVTLKKKLKIKTKDTGNTSQNIIPKQEKQSSLVQNLDIHHSSSLTQECVLVSSKVKKSKKSRKKNTVVSCESNNVVTKASSSQSIEISYVTPSKKRRYTDDYETENKKSKKIEKFYGTGVDRSCFNVLPLPDSEVVQEQAEELDCVDGSKSPNNVLKSGALTCPRKKLTLRDKMMEKLRGSRFRFLNEQMYNSKSKETRNFFSKDQQSFEAYHEGYKQQLFQWPVKPVDIIIKYLKKKPANYQIADFGCGDAKIAQSIPNRVHSFDYVALNDHVTACDMAHTPLPNGSVDVAVFCLSLMGSNLSDYISEANRVLKIGGILKIAEVESRFENVEKFIRIIFNYGFLCINRDLSRDVFYLFDFKKEKNIKNEKRLPPIELRACSYKKR